MILALTLNLGRTLLIAVMVIALSLAAGASAMACGGEGDTVSRDRPSSEERETGSEREQAEEDSEEARGEDGGDEASSEESEEESESSTRLTGLLAGKGEESESEDEESSSKMDASPQPALSGSDKIASGFSSISERGIGSLDALEFVPAPADAGFNLEFLDIKTILTDARAPDVIRTSAIDSYSRLEHSCIFPDEVDTEIRHYGVRIVSGDLNLGDIRAALERNGFTQETYRGYELWSTESYSHLIDFRAIAFPSDSGNAIFGRSEAVKDVLKALNRGSNLSAADSDVKRLLDNVSGDLRVRVATNRGPYARITSTSDEAYAIDIGVVSMSQSAQQAEAIAESTRTELEGFSVEFLNIESKAYESFAAVEATIDEKHLEWWHNVYFLPAFYSEGQLVKAGVSVAPPAPAAPQAPAAPRAQGAPTPTPAPMCPSRSQPSVPAPRADVATRSVSVPDEPLDLVPETAINVEVYDTRAILTDDDVPSVFRDGFVAYYNYSIVSSYLGEGSDIISIDEVDKIVRWQDRDGSGDFLIVSGRIDGNGVRDKLREQAFEQSEYRGFELWSYYRSLAFLGTHHIIIARVALEELEDLLGRVSRGAGMLTQSDDSTLKLVLDEAGEELTLVAGQNCVAPGCAAYAIATSISNEEYAMNIRYVGLFGSGQEAEAGVADMENYVNRAYDVVRLDSRINGEFAIVDAVVDEESALFR